MNLNNLKNHPDLQGISQEKLDFLMLFSKAPLPRSTQELSKKFMEAMAFAQKQNLVFNQAESSVLIEILKSQLSPQDQQRADKLIFMMRNFQNKK